ncbi:hypothetical protein BpHYR1_021228 [Brachionus plicatilis]|uniref:Uncharacterized protein n=1 Tax=Brachionus plicatilis TaxID=10195 RepID=A0A3M7T2M3_BRAPC|nr:hypothetical protein BpHYR1_021228 [Brachionus plicatilis]
MGNEFGSILSNRPLGDANFHLLCVKNKKHLLRKREREKERERGFDNASCFVNNHFSNSQVAWLVTRRRCSHGLIRIIKSPFADGIRPNQH